MSPKTISVVKDEVREPSNTAIVTRPTNVAVTEKTRPAGDLGVLSPYLKDLQQMTYFF